MHFHFRIRWFLMQNFLYFNFDGAEQDEQTMENNNYARE